MNIIEPIYDYILKGGFVIFPILLTSMVMWTFIFARLIWFKNVGENDLPIEEVTRTLAKGKLNSRTQGIIAFVLNEFFNKRTGDYLVDSRIIDESVLIIGKYLDKQIAAIAILAAVSPLFGLLGTVTGMIDTFDVITFFGTGNPRAMAAGISEALVTTQTGLLVAIPGMFMSVILSRKAKRAKDLAQETAMIIKRSIK